MRRDASFDARRTGVLVLVLGVVSCAAPKAPAQAAPSAPASSPSGGAANAEFERDEARAPETAPRPAPSPPRAQTQPAEAPAPAAERAPAAGPGEAPSSRTAALRDASRQLETAQRELDVAAGDCHNACRALGSMDRAAGRLCGLAVSEGEARRCDEAKRKLYSARDRVRTTCGECPGGPSVDRSGPVPSIR